MTQKASAATSAPEALQREEMHGWKALGLACTFGYVDGFTLMNLGVFTSFMTGNTTSTGVHFGQEKFVAAWQSLLPIPAFVAGAMLGTLLQPGGKQGTMARVLLTVAALLAFSLGALQFAAPKWTIVVLLSSAMGMLATTITCFGGQSASLGFITSDLKNLGINIGKALSRAPVDNPKGPDDTHWLRAALMASVWASFLIGAVLGTIAGTQTEDWCLMVPMLGLIVLAIAMRRHSVAGT